MPVTSFLVKAGPSSAETFRSGRDSWKSHVTLLTNEQPEGTSGSVAPRSPFLQIQEEEERWGQGDTPTSPTSLKIPQPL